MNDPIASFRAAFSHDQIHMNNAGVAPWCKPAREAVASWTERLASGGTHTIGDAMNETEVTRAEIARTLGAEIDEVAFFMSAAGAISQVALGFRFAPGDEILIWDQEYPSMFHPWKVAAERSGAKVIVIPSGNNLECSIESLEAAVTPKTKLIAFSWVQYRTGTIVDIQKVTSFAKQRGIYTCSDIIQGAGLLPFDFKESGLDFACGGSHKWFVSPVSAGYLLIKKEHLEKLNPILIGAMTFGGPDSIPSLQDKPKLDATRFEPGSRSVLELLGFGASLKFMREIGVARISQEAEWLARKLAHGVRERGYVVNTMHGTHHRGAIVNFSPGKGSRHTTVDAISNALTAAQVSHGRRPPGVRLSPHAFNKAEEIETVLSLL